MEVTHCISIHIFRGKERQQRMMWECIGMKVEIISLQCRVILPFSAACGFMGEHGSCRPWLNPWPSPLTQAIKARINSSLHWSINWIAFPTLAMAWPRRPAGLSNLLAVQIANALALTAPWIYVSTPETRHHDPPPSHQHPLDECQAAKQSNKYALSNSLTFTRPPNLHTLEYAEAMCGVFYWRLELERG